MREIGVKCGKCGRTPPPDTTHTCNGEMLNYIGVEWTFANREARMRDSGARSGSGARCHASEFRGVARGMKIASSKARRASAVRR